MSARLKLSDMMLSVLEGLQDSCLILDDEQRILYANKQTRCLLELKTVKGLKLNDLFRDQRIELLVKRASALQEPVSEECALTLPLGGQDEDRYLLLNAAAVRFRKGGTPYVRLIIRDETERFETEQVRKDFVANASHELRTPLSIINGYLENLLDGIVDDSVLARKCLQTMRKHGERIARIVEDMLTLSKFESGSDLDDRRSLRNTEFSCQDCVGDVIERLHPMIDEKSAKIKVDIAKDADMIAGDRFYWDQVFFNLVENALKENQGGTSISVSGFRCGDVSCFQIKDDGVGIPRADLPFVFKRFYRVAKHHSQQVKGTGLGLSIVRRAVEAHGGTISVDSIPGVETTFTIRLPSPQPVTPESCAGAENAESENYQFLLSPRE